MVPFYLFAAGLSTTKSRFGVLIPPGESDILKENPDIGMRHVPL
jgi:hypothetical protein